eukprot:CAMPEP_0171300310 /NCGR_PEP_ID=MMETSP0816-20121228/9083_1 /TAXON_ID=420281 /ORGANISM="Proboscia inermis, Strain CCAP1064/1" /LENGTH=471 /DNA_ID=CAMNT_0011776693 /DNA_START=44 /DNA_END=1459 /DNA_ORIENTATION=+
MGSSSSGPRNTPSSCPTSATRRRTVAASLSSIILILITITSHLTDTVHARKDKLSDTVRRMHPLHKKMMAKELSYYPPFFADYYEGFTYKKRRGYVQLLDPGHLLEQSIREVKVMEARFVELSARGVKWTLTRSIKNKNSVMGKALKKALNERYGRSECEVRFYNDLAPMSEIYTDMIAPQLNKITSMGSQIPGVEDSNLDPSLIGLNLRSSLPRPDYEPEKIMYAADSYVEGAMKMENDLEFADKKTGRENAIYILDDPETLASYKIPLKRICKFSTGETGYWRCVGNMVEESNTVDRWRSWPKLTRVIPEVYHKSYQTYEEGVCNAPETLFVEIEVPANPTVKDEEGKTTPVEEDEEYEGGDVMLYTIPIGTGRLADYTLVNDVAGVVRVVKSDIVPKIYHKFQEYQWDLDNAKDAEDELPAAMIGTASMAIRQMNSMAPDVIDPNFSKGKQYFFDYGKRFGNAFFDKN